MKTEAVCIYCVHYEKQHFPISKLHNSNYWVTSTLSVLESAVPDILSQSGDVQLYSYVQESQQTTLVILKHLSQGSFHQTILLV